MKKTKTGASTDIDTLERLSHLHELPNMILQYRQLTKLKNTYVDALPRLVYKKTGRIHTHFNQTITATGRLSSSDPNLQNIPIRTDLGKKSDLHLFQKKVGLFLHVIIVKLNFECWHTLHSIRV